MTERRFTSLQAQRELAADDPRDVQDVGDELCLRLGVVLDDTRGTLDRGLVALPDLQDVRPAEDRVQRRAQLVRERREELVLQPVHRLRVEAGALFPLEELRALRLDALALDHLGLQRAVRLGEFPRPLFDPLLHLAVRLLQRVGRFLDRLPLRVQLDEHRDLREQHFRNEWLEQVVDGADRVAAEDVRVALDVGGQKDDRREA